MLSVEDGIRQRLPRLSSVPVVSSAMLAVMKALTNQRRFNDLLVQAGDAQGIAFADRMLELLGTQFHIENGDAPTVPASGALLLVANHPLGMQDALVLLAWLGSIRPDVRVLGNNWLASVPALADVVLPVDVFGNGTASKIRHVYRALANGEAVIVFPAGEVSRLQRGVVRDGVWSSGFARLALRGRAPVLPVHVRARNSSTFYATSLLSKPLSTFLLPREATAVQERVIGLTVGTVISADELEQRSAGSPRRAAGLMRDHVYDIGRQAKPTITREQPIAAAGRVDDIAAALAKSRKLADLRDGNQLFLFSAGLENPVMQEIGRLRELTFRKVGEGTGKPRDLDAYDETYEHLVLWDASAQCIVGSYRLGRAARLLDARNRSGLYTATLFNFSARLKCCLPHGLELGRSFVAPAYWRTRALEQLWQGIGLYLQNHPELQYLFGAVSMPITLPLEAREWIAAAHLQYFGVPDLATARRPFIVSAEVDRHVQLACAGLDSPAGMGRLKQHLDSLGVSLPVLYRQYVDLVEPGGVQFLAFGVDPGFSGCVDGLVWVDLGKLKPAKRSRYLGNGQTATSAKSSVDVTGTTAPRFDPVSEVETPEIDHDALTSS